MLNDMFAGSLQGKLSIIGIGVDLCQIKRIKAIYQKFKEKFLYRVFHDSEIVAFYAKPENLKIAYLAKRFSVKEAISKSLSTGIGKYARLQEISCINDSSGKPCVTLYGVTHQMAKKMALDAGYTDYRMFVSLSDEGEYAVSYVVFAGKI